MSRGGGGGGGGGSQVFPVAWHTTDALLYKQLAINLHEFVKSHKPSIY